MAMVGLSAIVRPGERGDTAGALGVVMLVMMAHAMLETARDTFFLTNLPAAHLPWVYLAIAALAVVSGPILGRPGSERVNRRSLVIMQVAAAAGTAVFLLLIHAPRGATFYALYLWGGIAAAVILVRLWLILGDRLTATQAKRLFPLIASGAVLGSLIGYGVAGLVAARHQPRGLLAGSAAAFLCSAIASALWWRVRTSTGGDRAAQQEGTPRADAPARVSPWQRLVLVVRHDYVRRVAAMLLLASVAVTLCDFVFKSVVSRAIPGAHVGSFLASVYFACDLVSLVLLLVAVTPFVRAAGVPQALAVRPVLLAAAGAFLTASGGLAAAVALRGIDGSLRWSVHKTATELLYVPMAPRLRTAVKEFSDLLAQRGGQAIGSLLILGVLAVAGSERWVGPVLIACALLWAALALSLRRPYLDLFRETVNEATIELRLDFPELDVASLETMLAALSSPDDDRVLAALDLLSATGRVHVVPALILYHPATAVVVRALELFGAARRAEILPLARRLLSHRDIAVRAAAMRACARVGADAALLREGVASSCGAVSATALIASTAAGQLDAADVTDRVSRVLREADPAQPPGRFIAQALRDFPLPAAAPLLAELIGSDDGAARLEAVRAMGALRDPAHLPLLIARLADRDVREAVRAALVGYGDPGLTALDAALRDTALPRAVRMQVPRSIARFGHQRAANLLLRHLLVEPGGMVRYRILRGLGRMRADIADLRLDESVLEQVIDDHLAKTFALVHWRALLDAGAAARPERNTLGRRLLTDLLRQKEVFAIERLFRALGLLRPDADFAQLYGAVRAPDPLARAGARELLEHMVPARWREAVLGLTDDAPDTERLASGRSWYAQTEPEDDEVVIALIDHASDVVSALAAYHAAELRLAAAPERARAWAGDTRGMAMLYERALQRLQARAGGRELRHAG